tara:strand:+ start:4476 stop:6116 length:1641 start_codon:yes stop_codon:yes gene_type:complete
MNEDENINEEALNYEEFELSKEQEEYLYKIEENTKIFNTNLPSFIRRFQEDAVKVSFKNDIPAALSCFVILGQICKDFVLIPNGRSIEDSRVHFCQIQTSGSGKSTLWNFVGPVSKKLFEKINDPTNNIHVMNYNIPLSTDEEGQEEYGTKKFDVMSTTEYTDAALIGGYEEIFADVPVKDNAGHLIKQDENGREIRHGQDGYDEAYTKTKRELTWVREAGLLEGSGLAHWDEFEYSGIFKQSQNKEQAIVYLNTLMNTLAGESWIISKKLKRGDIMECFCERSILAMTYPPEKLVKVVANKGVLQRMILFIWDVPEAILDKMRRMQILKAGQLEEINQPIDEFADEFYEIYKLVQERFNQVGKDPLKTMKFTKDFNENLMLEYETMQEFIQDTEPVVRKIASNFTTRMLKILIKMAVLCSIAEAKTIENPSRRFTVSGRNVRQAGNVVRQCYNTLVLWLERSLKVSRRVGTQTQSPNEQLFLEKIRESKKDESGFFSKKLVIEELQKSMARATIHRLFAKYKTKNMFEENKVGRSVYLKLKEEKK